MIKHPAWKAAFVAACMAAAAAPVLAQTPPARPPEGARPAHPHMGPGHMGQAGPRGFSKPSERVEAHLAYQKTALKITDAQAPQWNAYAEQVRKTAKDMDQRMDAVRAQGPGPRAPGGPGAQQQAQRPNAIEGLERRQAMHAEAIRRINDRLAVQKPLYAALSPEQQKIADVVLSPRGHAGHMGNMGNMGHGGRMGGMGGREGMRGAPMMRGDAAEGMHGPMMGGMGQMEHDGPMHGQMMPGGYSRS